MEFSSLFALDSNELDQVSCVTHSIDTGDHRQIIQLPQWVPYSLRSTLQQLIREMLTRCCSPVIKSMGKPSCPCIKEGWIYPILR